MAPTLRRGSWTPVLPVLGAWVGIAAILELTQSSLTWWLALVALPVLGLALGWIERQSKLATPRPAPARPPLRLIDGGKTRVESQCTDWPAQSTETERWLM